MDNKQALAVLQNIDLTEIADAIAVAIQVLEGSIDEKIAFAEWILREGFEKYEDGGKCWWGKFNEEGDYSTRELFELWESVDQQQFLDEVRGRNAGLEWKKGAPDTSGNYLIVTTICRSPYPEQYDPGDKEWELTKILWHIGPIPPVPEKK